MIKILDCLALLFLMMFVYGCTNQPDIEIVSLNNTHYGTRLPENKDDSIIAEYRIVNKFALGSIWFVYKMTLTENDTSVIMQIYNNYGADKFREYHIEYVVVDSLYNKTKYVIDNYSSIRSSLTDRKYFEDGNMLYIQGYSRDKLEMLTLRCDEGLFNECREVSEIGNRLTSEFINKNDEIMKFLKDE